MFRNSNNLLSICLVGLGHHSRRIYFPLLEKYSKTHNIKLKGIIDVKDEEKDITKYLNLRNSNHFCFCLD